MYVHVEVYVDESAFAEWLKDNDYRDWDGSDLDYLTDYLNEIQPIDLEAVKIL
jgi:hypothetical protein